MGDDTKRFGRYLTGKILGTGGMGMVYEAYDPELERTVAIKVIHNARSDNQKSQSRFNREAKLVAKLEHPNIVPIYDYGVEENNYYIVMRLLGGGSLEVRTSSTPMNLPEAAALFEKLAAALQYAHTQGVVHRDIKLSNVLFDRHGTVYLADFGLAKLVGSTAGPTATGQVPGTPSYMAPELWRNQEATPASDIYALGVLAYRALSGQFPFEGSSPYALMLSHMFNKSVPLSQIDSAIPRSVDGIVARALEKVPENRYASAIDFSQALQRAASEIAASEIPLASVQSLESRPVEPSTPPAVRIVPANQFAPPLPPEPETQSDKRVKHLHNLPPQPNPFIGKIAELKQIAECLNDPNCRLLTLVGVGGSGKTRLAIEAGAALCAQFEDGCCFVSLASINSPQLIPMAIADGLNFSFQPQEEPKTQIIDYLHEKQILLVMDNFEHVLEGAVFVSEIFQHAPHVKIIATSRERLNLREEWLLPIVGMSYPDHSQELDDSYETVQLFSQCARRVRPDFSLEENIDEVAAICRTVEGLPLALEIAATWLSVRSLKQIDRELQQGINFLTTSLRNIDERHRSIRAVFDHSWNFLSEFEQHALMMLSVFRGGLEQQAAEQVADATLPILAGLVDKSMIRMQKSGRYDMHELVRQYAAEMLEASGQTDAARQMHGNYYAEFLKRREKELVSWGQLQAMRELAAEWDNVRVACDWIIACRDFEALDLVIQALYLYGIEFRIVDLQAFWRQAMPRFAPQPEEEPHIVWGRLLSRSIFVLGLHGSGEDLESEAMLLDLEKSFEIAGHYGRDDEIAYSLFAKGLYLHSFGDHLQAINYFEKSAILYHQIGDHFGEAQAHEWMGNSLGALGQEDASVQNTRIALRMFREQGDLYDAGWALLTLSFLPFYYTGNVKEAETFLYEAQQIHQSFGSPTACMMIEHHLKYIALWRGDLQQVEAKFNRTPTPQNSQSTRYHELNIPGISKALEGDYGAALAVFNSLSTVFIEENLANAWERYWGRLLAYSGIGDYAAARQCLELMYRAYLKRPDFLLVGILALPVDAFMLAQEGKFERAAHLLGLVSRYSSDLTGWTNVWPPTKQLPEELKAKLGSEAFEAALLVGREMTLDRAVALVLEMPDTSVPRAASGWQELFASPLPPEPETQSDKGVKHLLRQRVSCRRMVLFVAVLTVGIVLVVLVVANVGGLLPPVSAGGTTQAHTSTQVSAALPGINPDSTLEVMASPDRTAAFQSSNTIAAMDHAFPVREDYADSLTNNMRSRSVQLDWQSGQLFNICARSSEFDITLQLDAPNGDTEEIDDLPGRTDACIEKYVTPFEGTYTVTIGSYNNEDVGNYTLSITDFANCAPSLPIALVTRNLPGTPVNIRASASRSGDLVGEAMPDECFAVIGRSSGGDWWKIRTVGGLEGWIHNDPVDVIGEIDDLPVLES